MLFVVIFKLWSVRTLITNLSMDEIVSIFCVSGKTLSPKFTKKFTLCTFMPNMAEGHQNIVKWTIGSFLSCVRSARGAIVFWSKCNLSVQKCQLKTRPKKVVDTHITVCRNFGSQLGWIWCWCSWPYGALIRKKLRNVR